MVMDMLRLWNDLIGIIMNMAGYPDLYYGVVELLHLWGCVSFGYGSVVRDLDG